MSVRSSLPAAVAAGLLAALVGLTRPDPAAAAPDDAPPGLRYVPADAALFLHADAAQLYGGPLGNAVRTGDPKLFAELTAKTKALFGQTADDLRAVTVFIPKVALGGPPAFGVVVTFKNGYDKARLEKGVKELLEGQKFTLHTPDDRTAVVLSGLGDEFAKPRPAGEAGPLAAALKEAAGGKYVLVAGSAPANLPDEVRGDDLPPDLKPFQPLLRAKAVVGLVAQGKAFTAEVRVTADTPAKAVDAEKTLGMLAKLMQDGLAGAGKELGKDFGKDPAMKDVAALMAAADAALKGATFETAGAETRAVVRLPADLPFGGAYAAAVGKVRGAADRARSQNNLKQLALALHGYHDTYGAFPPAAVVDKEGKPLLSWRVLILPFIEQEQLYKQFKLDEAWDGPNNKKLLAQMPKTYALPDAPPGGTDSHYRVFTGNGAAFDLLQGAKIQDFTDGTSNTFLVVTAAAGVPWSKPDELPFDPDGDPSKLLRSTPGDVFVVAFADGSVRTFKKTTSPKRLKLFIQRNDNEPIGPDEDD